MVKFFMLSKWTKFCQKRRKRREALLRDYAFFVINDSPFNIVIRRKIMSRVCQITGKKPLAGHNVSHANNKTKRRFLPNLQTHRFWVPSLNQFVKLRLSAKGFRIVDKFGIEAVLKKMNKEGESHG